ncbi:Arc family DNA-binding protein [Salipiger marinus]|nr:Arc family DNA-binding protein [Salipiger manganoxidans]MEB3419895.1 Arc family DNA-binding protein [Salipiger manganoxidans]
MPRDLRDDLKIQAIRAGRSFNTHMVMILNAAIKEEAEES